MKLEEELKELSFTPKINKNSIKILNKKNEN